MVGAQIYQDYLGVFMLHQILSIINPKIYKDRSAIYLNVPNNSVWNCYRVKDKKGKKVGIRSLMKFIVKIIEAYKNILKLKKTPVLERKFSSSKLSNASTQLIQAFTKVLVLYNFFPKYYIYIETNTSAYIIGGIFCQLIPNQCYYNFSHNIEFLKSDLDKWHQWVFFSQKIVFEKTVYKTHNQKLLAIAEVFNN